MMHSYTASRALHILSISSVEGPLSSKLLIWLISVNVVVAAVRLLGCILPNNRRIWLLVPWVASFVACSSLLGLACSMRINDDEKHQKAFLGLLVGSFGVLIICEVNLLLHLEFLQLQIKVMIGVGMNVLTGLMVVGLCVSIVQGVELSLVLKVLLLSIFGGYLLLCIGFIYLLLCIGFIYIFLGPLRDAMLSPVRSVSDAAIPEISSVASLDIDNPWYHGWPWSCGWPLLCHAFLQSLISALALGFFIKSYADDGNLILYACILFTISNICTLRILLRQALQSLHTRFSPCIATLYGRFSLRVARIRQFLYQHIARFRRLFQYHHTIRYLAGFRTASSVIEEQYWEENALETGEQQWKGDCAASPGLSAVQGQLEPAFPKAIFYLDLYKLVYVSIPEVEPHEGILATIRISNDSVAMIVLKSEASAMEQKLGMICPPYNLEPNREDIDILGSVEARNQRIDALSRMAVDALLRDSRAEKGLWIYADPSHVVKLFTIWLKEIVSQSKEPFSFPELADIDIHVEAGRVPLDGTFDFELYTLVRLSGLGNYTETLDNLEMLGNINEVLSIEELPDGCWELPVLKSYVPRLRDEVGKIFPGCNVEPDNDPTEPSEKEVKEIGFEKARILRTRTFCDRAERISNEARPKAAAFYSRFMATV